MKFTQCTTALLLAGVLGAPTGALAQTTLEKLEAQVKQLQLEIEKLKAEQANQSNQLEAQGKEAVVAGDIPGSVRRAGTDLSVRVYGFAELNAVHEMKGDNSDSDYSTFLPYAPVSGDARNSRSGQTFLHARTSRIGIEASLPTSLGPMTMKVEGDFNNDPRTGNSAVYGDPGNVYTQQATNSYGLRLRHAFGQVGPVLVGQTWSTFMDLDSLPETVDFNGPIGATFVRQAQIRHTHATQEFGNFTAALENPVSYVLNNDAEAKTSGFSRVPDLVVRWDKGFDWGTLSLRGVTLEHRLKSDSESTSRRGWGLAASGMVKTVGDDFLTWSLTGGNGIGRYFNYIEGAIYDADNNRILMEKAFGWVIGYQHKASDKLRFNFSWGHQRNLNNEFTRYVNDNRLGSGQYGINRRLDQVHAGLIWNPFENVDLGAEYIWGQRKTLAGERGNMSRVNLSLKYNFN